MHLLNKRLVVADSLDFAMDYFKGLVLNADSNPKHLLLDYEVDAPFPSSSLVRATVTSSLLDTSFSTLPTISANEYGAATKSSYTISNHPPPHLTEINSPSQPPSSSPQTPP